MKTLKTLLVAGVAAVTLFAVETSAEAQSTVGDVDADITSTLAIAVTTPVAGQWALAATGNTDNTDMILTANANVPYGLQQNADTAIKGANATKLYESVAGVYSATSAHPDVLGGPALFIAADLLVGQVASAPNAITTAPANMNGATSQAASASRDHNVLLRQATTFADRSLSVTAASEYHIELTFTIVAGL